MTKDRLISLRLVFLALVPTMAAFAALPAVEAMSPGDAIAYGLIGKPASYSFNYEGTVVAIGVDRDVVASWLPAGLSLADSTPFPDAERHPVLFVLGTQSNFARHKLLTYHPRFGREYDESFIIVPYLRLADGQTCGDVSYYARLYLNNKAGTDLGRRLFGWPKVFSSIERLESRYTISALGQCGDVLLDAQFSGVADPAAVPRDAESFRLIEAMLAQPTVLFNKGEQRLCTMDFGLDTAEMASVGASVTWSDDFMPNMPANSISLDGIADQEFGAFRFKTLIQEDWAE